jgi:hypothetical protein
VFTYGWKRLNASKPELSLDYCSVYTLKGIIDKFCGNDNETGPLKTNILTSVFA